MEGRDGGASTISNVVLLARYFSRAATLFNRQPSLVVDALDKCIDVEGLLSALAELQKGCIRLFVTSRATPDHQGQLLGPSIDRHGYDEVRGVHKYQTACHERTGLSSTAPNRG